MNGRGKKGLNLTWVTLFLKSRFLAHTSYLQIQDSLKFPGDCNHHHHCSAKRSGKANTAKLIV